MRHPSQFTTHATREGFQKMLQKHITRLVSTTACGALAFLSAFAWAEPQHIPNTDLYSFLAKSRNSGILRGSDVMKYPKLAAILNVHSNDAAIAPQEVQQRFDQYVSSLARLFAGIDSNKDGKLSVLEIAQKVWYFINKKTFKKIVPT